MVKKTSGFGAKPSDEEMRYLLKGAQKASGKLPIFDENGQAFNAQVIRGCLEKGWAVPWFANPMKPDWLVCRLTDQGRDLLG